MIYLYCNRPSDGAKELNEALGGTRLRQFDGMDFWRRGKRIILNPDDVIVCWGTYLPEIDGPVLLNRASFGNKAEATRILVAAKIPTVKVFTLGSYFPTGVEVLPRLNNHIGGNDLLNPPEKPDFWVRKENFVKEYRIHSFAGKSIRAGVKVPREGVEPHAWIRSFDAGWRINYDRFESSPVMRKMAHKAVKALGLTFGAVDIGEKADGGFVVLEVNKAPGLEGNSITKYADSIRSWCDEARGHGESS